MWSRVAERGAWIGRDGDWAADAETARRFVGERSAARLWRRPMRLRWWGRGGPRRRSAESGRGDGFGVKQGEGIVVVGRVGDSVAAAR